MNFMPQQAQPGFPPPPGAFPPGPPQGGFPPQGFPPPPGAFPPGPPQGGFPPQGFPPSPGAFPPGPPQGGFPPVNQPQDNFTPQASQAPAQPSAPQPSGPSAGADPMGLDNMSDEEFAKMLQEIMGGDPNAAGPAGPAGMPGMPPAAAGPQGMMPEGQQAPQGGGLLSKILGSGSIVKAIGYGVAAIGAVLLLKNNSMVRNTLSKLPVIGERFAVNAEAGLKDATGSVSSKLDNILDDIYREVKDTDMSKVTNETKDEVKAKLAQLQDEQLKLVEKTDLDDAAKEKAAEALRVQISELQGQEKLRNAVDEAFNALKSEADSVKATLESEQQVLADATEILVKNTDDSAKAALEAQKEAAKEAVAATQAKYDVLTNPETLQQYLKAKHKAKTAGLQPDAITGSQLQSTLAEEAANAKSKYGQLDKVAEWMKGWGERLEAKAAEVAKEAGETVA